MSFESQSIFYRWKFVIDLRMMCFYPVISIDCVDCSNLFCIKRKYKTYTVE